jgi:hypothetical protein
MGKAGVRTAAFVACAVTAYLLLAVALGRWLGR